MKKKTILMVIIAIAIMIIAFIPKQVLASETIEFSNLKAGDIVNKGDKINLPAVEGKHYEISVYFGNTGGIASGEYEIGADTEVFDSEISSWKISYIKTTATTIMIDFIPTNYIDLSKLNKGDIINKGDVVYYIQDNGNYFSEKEFEISFFNGNYGSLAKREYKFDGIHENPEVKSWMVNEINLDEQHIGVIPKADLDFDDLQNRMRNYTPIIKGERLAYDLEYKKITTKDINIGVENPNGMGVTSFDGVAPCPWEFGDEDGCDYYLIDSITESEDSIDVILKAGYKINFNSDDVCVLDDEHGEIEYSVAGREIKILPNNNEIINVTVDGKKSIEVTKVEEDEDTYYTFTMPSEDVTINVEKKEEEIQQKEQEKEQEKDKTPKTGIKNINYIEIVIAAIAIVTSTVVLINKK